MAVSKNRFSVLLLVVSLMYSLIYFSSILKFNSSYMMDLEVLSLSSCSFSMSLIFDTISVSFSAVVTFISGAVFLFASSYMKDDPFYYRFMWILLSFVLSMNMLILSGSLLSLMVGWDGLGVSSFGLIIYYQSKDSSVSGFLTLLINRLGDITIMSMMFFFVLMGYTGVVSYFTSYQFPMLMLVALAAMTKSAQYPFSVWLPAAMAAPTPVSALVHSSTLVTAGVYILIRASNSMPLPADVMSLLLFCGSVTSFIGGSCALMENDLKKVIALSTLSQLGVMMFSLGLGAYTLTLLHLYTHAMFKALLFLVAGSILMLSYGVQDIRLLGSLTKNNPMLLVMMNISAFCLMGLPFLSSYYSKHVIYSMMWQNQTNLFSVVLMLLSAGLTSVYMIRLLKCMNWGVNLSVITSMPTSSSFYTPLYMLFMGSLLSGWFFSTMEMNLVSFTFLPNYSDQVLNSLVLLGILMGLLMYKRKGSKLLTSMMYMSPVWYNCPSIYYKLSSQIKHLDSGWLEPYFIHKGIGFFWLKCSGYLVWPKSGFNFMGFLLLAIMGYVLLWIYLKL